MDQSFTGKIILLGEYSIISGSSAMLMPLPQFSGKLQMPVPNIPAELEAEQSNFELRDFFLFLSSQQEKWKHTLELDTCRMGTDLDRGLYFLSSIPVQFGAGSSAAIVAAIYSSYSFKKIERRTVNTSDLIELT